MKFVQGIPIIGIAGGLTNTVYLNDELNRFIDEVDKYEFVVEKEDIDYQIAAAANSVSKEMLYMKFVQGIPIIGIAGGLTNTVYLKKIVDYAELKYRRRFLISKGKVL